MKYALSEDDLNLIRTNYKVASQGELARLTNTSKGRIARALKKMQLVVPREVVIKRRAAAIAAKYANTPHAFDDLLRKEYLTTNVNQLSIKVGRSETYVKVRLRALGLIIPEEVIAQRKAASRIRKGNVPPNKGKRQTEYMTNDQIARSMPTRFKKGQKSINEAQDGEIRIRHSSNVRGRRPFKVIRIAKGKWVELQIYNWEKKFGPVPKGMCLASKDGNSLNCDPENWEVISKKENLKRNAWHSWPEELGETVTLRARLTRKINRINKQLDEKQNQQSA